MPAKQSHKTKKPTRSLLGLAIGIAAIIISVFLVQQVQIFNQKASGKNICKVTDILSLRECFALAQSDESIDGIEITKQIVCSTKQDCEVKIKGRSKNSSLIIFGTPGTNAGFKRVEKYDYPLLVLGEDNPTVAFSDTKDVHNVTIKNLIFDETTTQCDFIKEGVGSCNSPLVLSSKTMNTIIDNVKILHAKSHGIQIKAATWLVIRNSIIYNSEGDGIWFDSAYADSGCQINFYNFQPCAINETKISKYITLENNLLADNKISAIEFYGYADEQHPNSIKGNLITHNHRDSKYKACPPPNGHCPGGQLAIARSKHVVVEENIIRDGHIDAINPETGNTYEKEGLLASGIELADSIQHITIKNNEIYNNAGTAVFVDYVGSKYNIKNVSILWNHVYGNIYTFLGAQNAALTPANGFFIANNIETNPSYPLTLKKAFIFADPPLCTSITAEGQCTTTIRWFSNDYDDLRITLKENPDSLFAKAAYGSQKAEWISPLGATFQLVDPMTHTILMSAWTKAENP